MNTDEPQKNNVLTNPNFSICMTNAGTWRSAHFILFECLRKHGCKYANIVIEWKKLSLLLWNKYSNIVIEWNRGYFLFGGICAPLTSKRCKKCYIFMMPMIQTVQKVEIFLFSTIALPLMAKMCKKTFLHINDPHDSKRARSWVFLVLTTATFINVSRT